MGRVSFLQVHELLLKRYAIFNNVMLSNNMADKFLILIIGLVVLNFLVEELLKYFNNKSRQQPIPNTLADVFTDEKYLKYRAYKSELYQFSVINSVVSLVIMLVMLIVGFRIVDQWVINLTDHQILKSLVFFGIIGLAADLLSTPFDLYSTFKIEQKYGFNTMTIKTFVLDKLKGWFLAVVIGIPILYLVTWLYYKFESDFWWMVWIVISVISIVFSFLYSNIIVPLFNKQTPLEEGELRDAIARMAKSVNFNLANIYVIDGSKRSTRANAYFTGFGSKKRIVLYDTLVNTQTIDQIVSVLAHEIGHYKKKHTMKGLLMSILETGVLLFLFSLVVGNPLLYQALETIPSFHIGIIVFMILYSPFSFLLSLGTNYISRRYEYQADDFAASNASAASLITALKSLSSNNMSDLTPHPWYVIAYYSHPPLVQRIQNLVKVKDMH